MVGRDHTGQGLSNVAWWKRVPLSLTLLLWRRHLSQAVLTRVGSWRSVATVDIESIVSECAAREYCYLGCV